MDTQDIKSRESALHAVKDIDEEISSADSILEHLYSINVIPEEFREDIDALLFFYNFIKTSQQPLSVAMLHFDLKQIKDTLKEIVLQQQEIILNQCIQQGQNANIIAAQNRQLQKLSAIERNSTNAVAYSRIAASNAEACAWIASAIYYK